MQEADAGPQERAAACLCVFPYPLQPGRVEAPQKPTQRGQIDRPGDALTYGAYERHTLQSIEDKDTPMSIGYRHMNKPKNISQGLYKYLLTYVMVCAILMT